MSHWLDTFIVTMQFIENAFDLFENKNLVKGVINMHLMTTCLLKDWAKAARPWQKENILTNWLPCRRQYATYVAPNAASLSYPYERWAVHTGSTKVTEEQLDSTVIICQGRPSELWSLFLGVWRGYNLT